MLVDIQIIQQDMRNHTNQKQQYKWPWNLPVNVIWFLGVIVHHYISQPLWHASMKGQRHPDPEIVLGNLKTSNYEEAARKRKAHSLWGHNANLAFTTFSTSSFKATGVRTCYSLCFLQDVAVCFPEERTLTTLSKRPLKWPALESDLHKVLKTHIKTSWRVERGHCKPYSSIPIPTTTGLSKPLTDNAAYSLAPILASLTDKVNHSSGLAGCTGALHL